jgi:hypothetical protein
MLCIKHVNSTWQEKVREVTIMRTNDTTYTELLTLRDRLDRHQAEIQRELDEVNKNLDSVSRTLELLDRASSDGTPAPRPLTSVNRAPTDSIDVASLRGMKQVDALKKIAEHGGGQVKTSIAKKLFLQAGLIKNPKNANNILFAVIQRSGLFERVEPGVYRFISRPVRPTRLGGEVVVESA